MKQPNIGDMFEQNFRNLGSFCSSDVAAVVQLLYQQLSWLSKTVRIKIKHGCSRSCMLSAN